MMPAFDIHAIANYSAMRIVDSVAEGTAVCVLTALALRLSRRQGAAARFALCFLGLLAIAVFPVTRGLWTSWALSKATSHHPTFVLSESWALYLFGIWAGVAALQLLGVARALLHLRKLKRSGVAVDVSTLQPLVQQTMRKGIGRRVRLCTSDRVRVPTAIGLVRPSILIPRWVLEELSAAELNQVLLHELAHLRRYDDWTNLAQQLVRAVFFFHPAVWWIEKKLAFERELACDDAVLAEIESPRAYAECLAHLAERSFVRRSIALAQAALGRVSETSRRISQILDGNRPRRNEHPWKASVSTAAGVVLVCGLLVAESPEWIAFRDTGPIRIATAARTTPADAPVSAHVRMASYTSNTPALTFANFKARPKPKHRQIEQKSATHVAASRIERTKTSDTGLTHLASVKATEVPTTETLLLVIETRDPNAPAMYQIQMWRVTVLRTQVDPSAKAPNKT